MKDKFTTDKFELDLSNLEITIEETNPRFKDYLSTKFTFPFEFNVDEHLSSKMSDYSSIQALSLKKKYEGLLTLDGKIKEATLNILSSIGKVVRAQIDLGFEEFPNANVKLVDLPLETITSNDGMIDRTGVLSKSYPETNYNFPMVWTDSYKNNKMFDNFFGAYNFKNQHIFIRNSADENSNEYNNYNIIIPMPYLLHVLKVGIESAGFTLHGDVLNSELIKQIILVPSKKITLFERPDNVEWLVGAESAEDTNSFSSLLESEQSILLLGEFRVKGKMFILNITNLYDEYKPKIWFNDELIWSADSSNGEWEFDFKVKTVNGKENKLRFRSGSIVFNTINALEAQIIPLELYNSDGSVKMALATLDKYNLAESLPDMDFISFVTNIKNLFNLDWEIRNSTEVWMNFIDNAFEVSYLKDISTHEVSNPERTYENNTSFLISYKDVESDLYNFKKVFYNDKGIQTENYVENENTHKIEINAVPLPMQTVDGRRTAHQFFDDESTLQLVRYTGLNNTYENLTTDTSPLLDLDVLVLKYHRRWFDFRLNSPILKWVFYVNKNHWRDITTLDNLFAYNRKLWAQRITKRSINSRTYEITLQAHIV